MIDVVMLNKDRRELKALHDTAYDISAFLSDSEWDWHLYADVKKLADYLETGGGADFSCLDLSCEQGVGWAETVRRKNADSFIMLVADAGISPMQYLKPSIMPGALLLRPFSRGQMQKTLRDALKQMLLAYEGDNRTGGFQLSQKADRKMIPYSQIYFFEAREKKVFINTGNQEYAVYDTIDNLQERLPEGFLRCHRSFIVAKSKIENVYLSKNYIALEDGITVPLSRSYKEVLKELK